ncbi:tyrosine-type recombinase/integrase [Mycobacterium asiaticum]|uniref:tyrosine-type recombinase/integrase n=1 Tax=Mycobacterium asiaticum TaxID=1790 RepID=UPI0007EFB9E3|nr:site-specific integrase [Mycobacterium asiaticum]OBJ50203.1 integrase [Mycobacterium asiaticum]
MARNANSEGSIYKRMRDGRHVGYVAALSFRDENDIPRRIRVYGATRAEAREKLAKARERLKQGAPAKDSTRTLASWMAEWRDSTLKASGRKDATKQLYAGLSRSHIETSKIGTIRLDKLRPSDVERLILEMRDKSLSASTIRSTYTVLRAALDGAVRDQLVARNVAAAVARPGLPRKEARHLSPAELTRLLDAAKSSRYHPALVLCAATGLRRGELMALKWSDVNLNAGTLTVRGTVARVDGKLQTTEPKSARSRRVVPLPDPLVTMLKTHRTTQKQERLKAANVWTDSGLVFPTELGTPCDPRSFLRVVEVAAAKAGLVNVGIHTLRHSAGTAWLENGVHIKQVADLLGHSSISITGDIYGHGSEDGARRAVEGLVGTLGLSK